MAVLAAAGCREPDPPLPSLRIDPTRISVSGISSGAYMAHQVHLAYSRHLVGAAMLAGGPYGCARGDLNTALNDCMNPTGAGPDASGLADVVRQRAVNGALDPLDGLAGDRVLVLHGRDDARMAASVSQSVATLYRALARDVSVQVDADGAFAHVFPTAADGNCAADDAHMAACGRDVAGQMIASLHAEGPVAAQARGRVVAFDQRPYADDAHDPVLADRGYLYVPPQCEHGTCGLHIVFHGCEMNADRIGLRFVEGAGYNRHADAADLVVLYPQTRASMVPLNPKACWDWWGYSGSDYDTRDGAQMRWLMRVFAHFGVAV